MHLEIRKKFSQDHSNVLFGKYLTNKYSLWIDTRLSTDNQLHGSGRLVNRRINLQIDKVVEISGGDLMCYGFAIQNVYAYFIPVMKIKGDCEIPTKKKGAGRNYLLKLCEFCFMM